MDVMLTGKVNNVDVLGGNGQLTLDKMLGAFWDLALLFGKQTGSVTKNALYCLYCFHQLPSISDSADLATLINASEISWLSFIWSCP